MNYVRKERQEASAGNSTVAEDKRTDRQTKRQTDRQTYRQTDRQQLKTHTSSRVGIFSHIEQMLAVDFPNGFVLLHLHFKFSLEDAILFGVPPFVVG